jgi:hypothetical protein
VSTTTPGKSATAVPQVCARMRSLMSRSSASSAAPLEPRLETSERDEEAGGLFAVLRRGDTEALVRRGGDKPLGGQPGGRLAQGDHRDAESARELARHALRTLLQIAGHDAPVDLVTGEADKLGRADRPQAVGGCPAGRGAAR